MQWVCYIEVQGLYAAAARAANPSAAAGRPVVVLQDGRAVDGCRDAFVAGLVLGAPARQVQRDVAGASLVELSEVDGAGSARSWWDQCLNYTPYIEPGEPHQIYLSLPSPGSGFTLAQRNEVNALVKAASAVGFMAFAGVAANKLVARAAALKAKEQWLCRRPGQLGKATTVADPVQVVLPGEEAKYLAPLPVRYLPAVREVQRRLGRLGLYTVGEVARISEGEWIRQLGPVGRQLSQWSQGMDPESVKPAYPPRSLERRVAFSPEARDKDHLEQVVNRAAVWLSERLTEKGEGCQEVALLLEPSGGAPITAVRTLAKLQQAPYSLQQALRTLLGQALAEVVRRGRQESRAPEHEPLGPAAGWDGGVPIASLTVSASLIGPMPWVQLDLWDDAATREREERVERALLYLHERFPARVIGRGPRQEMTFREQMLSYSDPYRWAPGGGGKAWRA